MLTNKHKYNDTTHTISAHKTPTCFKPCIIHNQTTNIKQNKKTIKPHPKHQQKHVANNNIAQKKPRTLQTRTIKLNAITANKHRYSTKHCFIYMYIRQKSKPSTTTLHTHTTTNNIPHIIHTHYIYIQQQNT